MSDGMPTTGSPLFFATSALAPAMSSTRVPSTSPTCVLPPASNVASLNGVSGLLEIVSVAPPPRCARAGATRAIVRTKRIMRRMEPSFFQWRAAPPPRRDLSLTPRLGFAVLGSAWPQALAYDTAARLGDSGDSSVCHHRGMTNDLLSTLSNQFADAVAAASPSVVQVQGRRR